MTGPGYCGQCGAKLHGRELGGLCHQCVGRGVLATGGRSDRLLETKTPAPRGGVLGPSSEEVLGAMIGPYRLRERLGEGGMGVVYLAEQEQPVRRRVALKLIKVGRDTRSVLARFEAERQALALMEHPHIARVFDVGSTATATGRPYIVMELVCGLKITAHCDEHQLSTRDRLVLFVLVCQAIEHAHHKGIIHLDLKPSNIMVTVHEGAPIPKIIDFGIAKAIAQKLEDKGLYTEFQALVGTPAYMSPEQADLSTADIDARSDIYALGVLLYQLLIGQTPFDGKDLLAAGFDEMRRTILEKEPIRPSTRLSTFKGEKLAATARRRSTDARNLILLLEGDLDRIVMKCLEKDRAGRYDTVNGLAMDLNRYLANEPLVARRLSPL